MGVMLDNVSATEVQTIPPGMTRFVTDAHHDPNGWSFTSEAEDTLLYLLTLIFYKLKQLAYGRIVRQCTAIQLETVMIHLQG